MKPSKDRATRDLKPPGSIRIHRGCIDAMALRTLASAMDRLMAFHDARNGPATEAPCLVEVLIENGDICARVLSGDRHFRLQLVHGGWEFR